MSFNNKKRYDCEDVSDCDVFDDVIMFWYDDDDDDEQILMSIIVMFDVFWLFHAPLAICVFYYQNVMIVKMW